jgi:hypothetical protein
MATMYKNMSFNCWMRVYEKNLPKRNNEMLLGLERPISDEDEVIEEEEPKDQKVEYGLETEEEEEVDEYDQEYIAWMEEEERKKV